MTRTRLRCGRLAVITGELLPGVLTQVFARVLVEAQERARLGLEEVGKLVHERAVQSVSARSHPYRTATPASRGGPPAMISGTLSKSLTVTPATPSAQGWQVKVGTAPGMYPACNHRTPSSKYGYYLEVAGAGKSHVRYPFLAAAAHAVAEPAAYTVFKALFAGPWG